MRIPLARRGATAGLGAGLALLLLASTALGDGGVSLAAGPAGPFEVNVLVSPVPLRAGPSEWSLFVREEGQVVLDADVELELRRIDAQGAGAALLVHPGRDASVNHLLRTARIELPAPGAWEVRVRVRRGDRVGELVFPATVASAPGPLTRHWRALSLPPLALGLFALHQGLGRRRRPGRP